MQTTTAVVPEAALTLHDTGNVAESVAASEGGTTPEATKPEQQSPTPALPATERNAGEGQDTIHSSGDPSVPINATDPWLNRRNSNVLSGPLELTDSFKKALEQMPVLPKRLHFACGFVEPFFLFLSLVFFFFLRFHPAFFLCTILHTVVLRLN